MLLPKNAFCQNSFIKKIIGHRLARISGVKNPYPDQNFCKTRDRPFRQREEKTDPDKSFFKKPDSNI